MPKLFLSVLDEIGVHNKALALSAALSFMIMRL